MFAELKDGLDNDFIYAFLFIFEVAFSWAFLEV